MKFSFNAENYRNTIKEELLAKRKEDKQDALSLLEKEKQSNQYKTAEAIKRSSRELDQRKETFSAMENLGFDVIDLSEQIPEEINMMIDKEKLRTLSSTKGNKFKELDIRIENQNEVVSTFLDKITDGKYSDKRNPNHVINAADYDRKGTAQLQQHTEEDENYYSYLTKQLKFEDNTKMWVSFGRSKWVEDHPDRPIVIFTLENPTFKKLLVQMESDSSYADEVIKNRKKDIDGKMILEITQSDAEILPEVILRQLPVEVSSTTGTYLEMYNPLLLKTLPGYSLEDKSIFTWPLIASYIIDLTDKKMYKFNIEKYKRNTDK